MPYIGRSTDGFGVRNRFLYLASASDTSVSGADANGAILSFSDGAYVDVYLNGVLLKAGTDYNTNTANTIAGISSMSANDEVTVIVYDIFAVADTVSQSSGGTVSGAITFGSTVSGLDVNGTEIILDADGDTTITADTDDQIDIKIAGADDFQFTANTFTAQSGSTIAAQALTATTITASDDVTFTGDNYNVVWYKSANDLTFGDNAKLNFGAGDDLSIYHDGSNTYIDESGTGALFIRSRRVSIHKYTGETMINAAEDGAVSLYYDDSKMLETSTRGVMVGGGTAETFNSGMSSMQVGRGAIQQWNAANGATYVSSNLVYNTSGNWEYIDGGGANLLSLNNGSLYYYHAQNGSDGGTATLIERMRLYNNNSNNDNYNFFIANRNSISNYFINEHSSDPYGIYIYFENAAPDNNTQYFLRCVDSSTSRMTVFSDGDIATADAGFLTSDIKNKHTITDASDKWDDVKKLKVRNFYWNEDYHPKKKDKKMIGFIAQEFETVFPGLVSELKDEIAVNEKDENGNDTKVHKDLGTTTKHIKEGKLIPILTKALQEAMERIEALEAKVKALEEA